MKWNPKLPGMFVKTPPHTTPREWRSSIALVASILGSIALTIFAAIVVYILWLGGWEVDTAVQRIDLLGKALLLALSGSLVVLITLGFAINRRSIRLGRDGFEAIGGDGSEINNSEKKD